MRRKRHSKGKMMRQLVYYCITVLSLTALWAVVLKTIDHTVDLTDVLTFISVVFGGELLMLVLKRIFAKGENQHEQHSDEAVG